MNNNKKDQNSDLVNIRARLADTTGKEYWRSLDELSQTTEFQELIQQEFPQQNSQLNNRFSRRRFLQLMAASLAFAGYTACVKQPMEKIVPYVRPPEDVTPGKPLYFATAMTLAGFAMGLLVESHEGRPTKIEGNPEHPASLGATDIFSQASILSLYDPDRSQSITYLDESSPWPNFLSAINFALNEQRAKGGSGIRILTETISSPTLANQLKSLLATFPAAKWHQYEPINFDGARAGAQLAFGQYVNTIYDFNRADRVLSLDADFLSCWPSNLRYAHDFIAHRRALVEQANNMNRLYVVESLPSNTGALADNRLPLPPSEMENFVRAVAAAVGVTGVNGNASNPAYKGWIDEMVADLRNNRGSSIIIAGDYQPPIIHALAHAINQALDNIGKTVFYTDPIEANPIDQVQSLRELTHDLDAGLVDLLVIVGGNPVYNAPVDLNFAQRIVKAKLRVHHSLYNDETSQLCHWHIPATHYLETWSDARAYDGTISIQQPLIAPLYNGKSAHELIAIFSDQQEHSSHDIVYDYWQTQHPGADFEQYWRKILRDGLIADSALKPKTLNLNSSALSMASTTKAAEGLEIIFRPDPTIFDGRFANNGWLQELPKPLTRLTWDNAVIMSQATAQQYNLDYKFGGHGGEHGEALADTVELNYQGRKIIAPIWILPGHADNCVTLHLGYGRQRAGQVGNGCGFNVYQLRDSNHLWQDGGLQMRKAGKDYPLACVQGHFLMENRDIVRAGTLAEYQKDPTLAPKRERGVDGGGVDGGGVDGESKDQRKLDPPAPSLYPGFKYEGYAWGMAIDLNACVGCGACVVACQAENNIPIVGKEQVMAGREMHWLRVDRYYKTIQPDLPLANPQTYFQPVPCMHCENAPCELVCPVGATVHSAEGLNDMVYNRCVGTRYCSNNCPYKVRRFNFLQFADYQTPSLKLMRNPDVTVRSRGVMEKCTYCVQRIDHARAQAQIEDRRINDGDIVTACQAVCPTEAIIFGDINDANSRVAKLKTAARNYGLLTDLNTRPRTTYLAALRNPNSEIGKV
jgi:molybdopterin-containing oxidoreductase family iron-sulfur binding subunit